MHQGQSSKQLTEGDYRGHWRAVSSVLLAAGFATILWGKAVPRARLLLILSGLGLVVGSLLIDRLLPDDDRDLLLVVRAAAVGLLLFGASLIYPGGPAIVAIPVGLAALYGVLQWTRGNDLSVKARELALASFVGVGASLSLLGWFAQFANTTRYDLRRSWYGFVGLVFFAALNSLAEEAVFRMPLLSVPARYRPATVVLSAAAFGLAHVDGIPSGTVGMVLAGLFGLVQSVLLLRTRSIWTVALSHFMVDVVVGGLLLFGQHG